MIGRSARRLAAQLTSAAAAAAASPLRPSADFLRVASTAAARAGLLAPASGSSATGAATVSKGLQEAAGKQAPPRFRLTFRRLLSGLVVSSVIGGGAYAGTRDPATLSEWGFKVADFVAPTLRLLDPETAHRLALWNAAHGLVPREYRPDPLPLHCRVWGRHFSNPLGLAAGFDKSAEAVEGLLGLGFGFVEVGTVTPAPQEGNPKPRVFRLPEQKAVINRYGFNSEGIVAVARRLGAQHGKRRAQLGGKSQPATVDIVGGKAGPGIVGVNLGKNKTSVDAAADYVQGVHTLSQFADYLVVNVSSPNTPGLRKLQGRKQLQDLLKKVLAARDEMQWGEEGPPPLLVKIAPDLTRQDMADIAAVALALRLDGLVIANTTVSRPQSILGLVNSNEVGGLSGKPLFELSTYVLREMYRLTKGRIPLIGCGGISSGEDAYTKIKAGASLIQIYTSLAYEGAGVVPRMKRELAECLYRDGYKTVAEAVGADHYVRSLR
eukprot:SM000171S03246  [mRNA]  locus=s171:200950:204495:+ [translate_table: standard]